MNSALISFTSGIADYLLYASIITAILVTIAWAIIKLAKIRSPVYRHMIWLFTLLAVLLLPVVWLYGPKVPVAVLPAHVVLTHEDNMASVAPQAEIRHLDIQSSNPGDSVLNDVTPHDLLHSMPVKKILVFLWYAGFIFMSFRLLISWHRIHRIMRSAEPISYDAVPSMSSGDEKTQLPSPRRRPGAGTFWKHWIPALAGMTARLRVPAFRLRQGYGGQVAGTTKSGRLRLLLSPDIDSPICFGILRSVILLPKKMYANGISEDLDMVLHHELAHIKRRDCLINIFQRLIEAILFFHPFIWYASSQLTRNREILCDQHVIAKGASPTDYVQLLTRIVEQGFQRNSLYAVALFEGRLLPRVRSLLESGENIQLKTSRIAIISGIMVILLCTASGAIHLEPKSNPVVDQRISEKSKTDNQNAGLMGKDKDIENTGTEDLGKQINAIEEEPDTANKQLSEDSVQKAETVKNLAELQKKIFQNAGYKKMLRNTYKGQLDTIYGSLYSKLNLSPEKLDRLKDLLIDQAMSSAEISLDTLGTPATEEKRTEIQQRTDDLKKENDAKISELLGNEDFQIYESYRDTLSERQTVEMFAESLSEGDKLTEVQKESLIASMSQKRKDVYSQQGWADERVTFSSEYDDEGIAKMLDMNDRVYEGYIKGAGDTLSASQMEQFKKYLKNQSDMTESLLKVSARMYGG